MNKRGRTAGNPSGVGDGATGGLVGLVTHEAEVRLGIPLASLVGAGEERIAVRGSDISANGDTSTTLEEIRKEGVTDGESDSLSAGW